MTRPKFVLASTSDRYDFEWERAWLAEIPDFEFDLRPAPTAGSIDTIAEYARDADALLVSSREVIDRVAIAKLERCKVIARYAVGLDHIDLDAAAESGIVVTHYPMYCTREVADHALAFILALNRRIVELDRDLRSGAWVTHAHQTRRILRGPVLPLRESTVGLLGIGRIGTEVAARLAPFGARIIAHDPHVTDDEIRRREAEPVSFTELLESSDTITVHCPLTPESRGMIDGAALARMKTGAMLVNTARGPIVVSNSLVDALDSGRLGGAALDVVDPEPLPLESRLYTLPNVILSPHSAYYSERSVEIIRRETLLAAVDVLMGRMPPVVANPAVLDRVSLAPPRSVG